MLREGASEMKGENARIMNIMGAVSIADIVKSTLGPHGMDKILQSGDRVSVTNDGATILRSLPIDNPAAKLLIDVSRCQDDQVGDGTTSVVVFSGELLRRAERLLDTSIHPQTIIAGYRRAVDVAMTRLNELAVDRSTDAEAFRHELLAIARTTLSSKIVSAERDHFAGLCVDAVLRLKPGDTLDMINLIKKLGGTMKDSFLEPGFLLDKKIGIGQPRVLENAKILVANTPMDSDKIKVFGAKVRVESISQLADVEKAEKEKMKHKCEQILAHGVNCFINRQLIYNYPEELFAQAGVMAIEHADFDGIERLAKALGADVLSTFDATDRVQYGFAKKIDEIMIGESPVIRFSGLPRGEACTIVLRGMSAHLLDEVERSLHDALCVIQQTLLEKRSVQGAGASEIAMALAVEDAARGVPGKQQLAMQAFADALKGIPSTIADNAGLDSHELVAKATAAQHETKQLHGIDVLKGVAAPSSELGVTESFAVKSAVVRNAFEAAEMLLRVDNILRAAPRQRTA